MTPDEMIAVIQAHKEGKMIEAIVKRTGHVINAVPIWDFCNYDYRIKPEPKPDVERIYYVMGSGTVWSAQEPISGADRIRLTFDGETGKLKKAEVI